MSALPLPSGAVDAVHRALRFIEDHLSEPVSVADLAAAAGFSLFHFVRVFDAAVHHTPYDYLVRRRLSEAAGRLTSSEARIIDLALEAGFAGPEAFSRAFHRMFGCGPAEYRQAGGVNASRRLAPRTLEHLRLLTHPDYRLPQRVEQPALRLAGLMSPLWRGSRPAEVQPDTRLALWTDLGRVLSTAGIRFSAPSYGVSLDAAGCRYYLAAVELNSTEVLPGAASPPLVRLELPAAACAAFTHPGPLEKLPLTRDYIYQTWLPLAGLQPAAALEIEIYPAGALTGLPPAGPLTLLVPLAGPPAGVEIPQPSKGKP